MKKTVFYGLLAIVLAFGFIGCDDGNNGSNAPFSGTWEGTYNDIQNYTFTGNDFLVKINGTNHVKGTFSYTNSQISMTNTHMWNGATWVSTTGSYTVSYNLNGNTLTLSGGGYVTPLLLTKK